MLAGCTARDPAPALGDWTVELQLPGARLPFQWTVEAAGPGAYRFVVRNAEESIAADEVRIQGDSVRIRMPLFDSEFIGALQGDSAMAGIWRNPLKGDGYAIPFAARAGRRPRFRQQAAGAAEPFAGTWEARFSPGTADAYNAIGAFSSAPDGSLAGTFMTETGDYRFLAGAARGDSLWLSSFDGAQAFLFGAALRGDSLHGRFWSGKHWEEPWVAVRNPGYRLRDADSLTFLKAGSTRVDFRFPDTEGALRSPADADLAGHPLLVQIMGTWCPNCLDESLLLREMHERFGPKGLRILAVAFEKQTDREAAMQALCRYKERLALPYPLLYGGEAAKEEAARKLPFLDRLISYPTCIFIDRHGQVRRIRTGFYGPGTGVHYQRYREQLIAFLERLVEEA